MRAKKPLCLDDELLALSSLSRALGGTARLSDVGSLLWVLLRQVVPCDAMALFMTDETEERLVVRYAAGVHAQRLVGVSRPASSGIAGWVALHRRPLLNAEPVFDLGVRANIAPALRSSVVVPLVGRDRVVAVLALYSRALLAFTDDHAHTLELLGPRLALALVDTVITDEEMLVSKTPVLRLVVRSTSA